MNAMFSGCISLTELDVSGWNTASVQDTGKMFMDCESLKKVDISGWNLERLENKFGMFFGCAYQPEREL